MNAMNNNVSKSSNYDVFEGKIYNIRDPRNVQIKNSFALGLAHRVILEKAEGKTAEDQVTRRLNSIEKDLSAYSLAFFRESNFNPAIFCDTRKFRNRSTMYNVYAITKLYHFASVLAGAEWGDFSGNDEASNAGVITALWNAYQKNNNAPIANYTCQDGVYEFMISHGRNKTYSSQGTQTSSSMRALLALGIVAEGRGDNWNVVRPDIVEYLAWKIAEEEGEVGEEDAPEFDFPISFTPIVMPSSDFTPKDWHQRAFALAGVPYDAAAWEDATQQQEAPQQAATGQQEGDTEEAPNAVLLTFDGNVSEEEKAQAIALITNTEANGDTEEAPPSFAQEPPVTPPTTGKRTSASARNKGRSGSSRKR